MYYRQDNRRELFPMGGQRFGPQMPSQQYGPPRQNGFSRLRDAFYPSYPQNQQQFYPYQQAPDPRFGQQQPFYPFQQGPQQPRTGGLSDNLNTMMGHVGTITNGINMMRQMGSILSIFR